MTFKMSEEAQTLKVFNFLSGSHEFIGPSDMYIPPHTGLPANCTLIAPPDIPAGKVAVFDEKKSAWLLQEDHRGKTVYDIATGQGIYITEIGPLPDSVVTKAPDGPHRKWNGKSWVKDKAAEQATLITQAQEEKSRRMREAGHHISLIGDAVELEMATEEEKARLIAWKKYRVLLNRINPEDAQKIQWPDKPE